jgi:SAM-dependent methyltransferase
VADEQRRRATARLIERLSAEDVEAVEQALEGDPAILWRDCDAGMRERLLVSFGVWYRIPGVLEKTGLTPDEPPPGVHAMARGPLAAGGDLYTADLVADCLAAAGTSVADVHRALDFGCSSGRTVRALAAAYPEVEWHGVDPNAEAVRWAAEHVPGVRFAVSGSEPPLDFADGTFDLVYAISIWSHFDEPAALAWLEEMRRVIAPGGHLVLTVHGLQSVAVDAQEGARPPGQLEEIRRVLYRRGFWFAPEFGEDGDHGVSHPEWGTSFISPEWLLRSTTPAWDIVTYDVGRNDGNQDAIVLRRPPA